VSIYCNNERVAYHLRDNRLHKYTTVKKRLPTTHRFVAEWHPDKFISWAAGIDPVVEHYIRKVLENKSYPKQTYRSCLGILSFDRKAGRERLIAGATEFETYNYKVIEQIIHNKLDPQQGFAFTREHPWRRILQITLKINVMTHEIVQLMQK
jgi:hypothetical protein